MTFLKQKIHIIKLRFTLRPPSGGEEFWIILLAVWAIITSHQYLWVRWFMMQGWVGVSPCPGMDRGECDLASWKPSLSRGFCIHGTGTVMQPASPRGIDEVTDAEHWATPWACQPCSLRGWVWFFSYSGFACRCQAHYFTCLWGLRGLENNRTSKRFFGPSKPSALQTWKLIVLFPTSV